MGKRRKVIIIGPAWPLRGGGISTFNERLARAYKDRGDDVTIYTFSLQYPSFLFPGTTQYSDEPAPEGLDIKVTINSVNPLSWRKTGKEISRMKPDLVVVRFWIPFMGPSLGTISGMLRKKGIKVVAIVDNIIPHEPKPFDRILSNYFVKRVSGFVTMSEAVLNDLKQFDAEKPKLLAVHPLYDNFGEKISREEALKSLSLEEKYRYILFFGFIREYKGLDLLLKAFASERLRQFPLKLLVAGEFYVDKKPYLELIDKLGIREDVILHDQFIPNTEVRNYFCAASLVVQPYKDATQSGITQVAYHFEKPIITTNVGGLAEIVTNGRDGYVTEPDPKQITEAIYKFFKEEKEAEFTANVKEDKKRFSWDKLLETIDKI
jgi:glycosyltransferase involved in cell wall biosynthesis